MGVKTIVREYVASFTVALVLASFIIAFIMQSFLVQGSSMEPTLHHGERLMVDKVTYRFREPKRGEIVVFRYPSDTRRKFIKRVIGLPGDLVEVRKHLVYVNGVPLNEPYIKGPTYRDFGPVIVPEDTYFVLGDNRNNSDDSRFPDVGPVPRRLILGRALFLYWPLTRISPIVTPEQLQVDF
ncbi:MAG: signal peptidase I [Limnochordia bacterium]